MQSSSPAIRTSRDVIYSIQYLRGVAALMVVYHHMGIQIDMYGPALSKVNQSLQQLN